MTAPGVASVPWDSLTRREREIVRLVCEGRRRSEVVELLGIAPKTFDSHRFEAMRKLGVTNEVQLVRLALAVGWVEFTSDELARRPAPP